MRKLAALLGLLILVCVCAVALAATHHRRPQPVKAVTAAPMRFTVAARVGEVLHAPAERSHVRSYRWLRCSNRGRACQQIRGATRKTYRVTRRDIGHTIRVRMRVVTPGGGVTTVISDPSPIIVGPAPTNLTLPTISGVAQQGATLTAAPGTWTNAVSFAYQWEDCDAAGANCVPIADATATTYTLAASDVGDTIRVVVTAFNAQASARALSPVA